MLLSESSIFSINVYTVGVIYMKTRDPLIRHLICQNGRSQNIVGAPDYDILPYVEKK